MSVTERTYDQVVREQALQIDSSFIVQAPAGSGKTSLLIKRYLRLLSLVNEPEEVIAITFTRKAAAEMQGRVLRALDNVVTGNEPGSDHELETYVLASAALKRCQDKGWNIASNPSRLRIQTIDSLCAQLTRQMPLLAQLGSQPEIIEDALPLYRQAAIYALAELEDGDDWSDAIAKLVLHQDNDLPRVKSLIVNMLLKRDQWLSYVLENHDRNDMEQAVIRIIEEQLVSIKKKFPSEFGQPCVELLNYAAENLQTLNPEHPVARCGLIDSFPAASAESLPIWRALRWLLLTKQGSWRKRSGIDSGFPAATDKLIDRLTREYRQAMKLKMQSLLQDMQNVDGLLAAIKSIDILPASSYSDDEWQTVKALCDLLKLAAIKLDLLFAERNQMDFIGIAERAVLALGNDDSPTELARHLDYQVRHLLVDEFQDVSMRQMRLIRALTREWSLGDGRTLFLVGDPMQSIYRFREADVSIFMRTFHNGRLGHVLVKPLRLGVNFRSQRALVDWVNNSFKALLPEQDNMIAGAVSYSESQAFDHAAANNNVAVYPYYDRSFTAEATKVSALVAEIQQAYPGDSIAILVRSRSHLGEIVPALRECGLYFQAIDIERLDTRPAIQDLLALTRAWLYPADRVAWLACLRAPWCGLTLASLYCLCHEDKQRLVMDSLQDPVLLQRLSMAERNRAERFIQVFNAAWSNRQRTGLSVAIESLWCQLGGPATLVANSDLQNCSTFFSLLESIENGATINRLEELLAGVAGLYAAPDYMAAQGPQLMTIHKAKGLEFDHVILPGLGRSTKVKTDELLVWLLREHNGFEDLILAPIREVGAKKSPIYEYINNVDKEKQLFEDQRLLYVACTRSRKTLHLLGHARLTQEEGAIFCGPYSRSLLASLWPAVRHVYEQYRPSQIISDIKQSITLIEQSSRRLTENWSLPELPCDLKYETGSKDTMQAGARIEFEWAGETIKRTGLVVHRVLQWIAEEGVGKWHKDRVEAEQKTFAMILRQLGVPAVELDHAVAQVSHAINNLLADERGQWILSDKHIAQRNEYAISGIYNGSVMNVIIDRTFIDADGTRWIIDYKVNRHEGAEPEVFLDQEQGRYMGQMSIYGYLLKRLGDEPVRLALYFPLMQGWREWAIE